MTKYVERPAGVDGWLPIDALMNLKLALLTGRVPRVHPAGMFLLLAFLAVSLLLAQSVLLVVVPGRHALGISVEAWPQTSSPQFSAAALGRTFRCAG